MGQIFNRSTNKLFRQKLRKEMTKPEIILWSQLKNCGLEGFKFRRQHGIGPYIVDFYCPKAKLIIELDDEQHFENKNLKYDNERDNYLHSLGLKILRFANPELNNANDSILDQIRQALLCPKSTN